MARDGLAQRRQAARRAAAEQATPAVIESLHRQPPPQRQGEAVQGHRARVQRRRAHRARRALDARRWHAYRTLLTQHMLRRDGGLAAQGRGRPLCRLRDVSAITHAAFDQSFKLKMRKGFIDCTARDAPLARKLPGRWQPRAHTQRAGIDGAAHGAVHPRPLRRTVGAVVLHRLDEGTGGRFHHACGPPVAAGMASSTCAMSVTPRAISSSSLPPYPSTRPL